MISKVNGLNSQNIKKNSPSFGNKFIIKANTYTPNFSEIAQKACRRIIAKEGINAHSFSACFTKSRFLKKDSLEMDCLGGKIKKSLAKKYAKEMTMDFKGKKLDIVVTYK